jgi:hypothetical protein
MHDLKAQELNQHFLSGEITAKEVARYFLQRAHAANSSLGCFLEIFDQQVLEKAELLDKKKELGLPVSPLACVPFSVKDNIHIKDKKTRAEFIVKSREEAVSKYREWILQQPHLLDKLESLRGKTLGCWCKPKACHGDVLVQLLREHDIRQRNSDR